MSGRKNTLKSFIDPLINNSSMASSITGTATNVEHLDNLVYQFVWTGANPIGTINIQLSLDNVNWTTLQLSPGNNFNILPGGSPGNYMLDLDFVSSTWIRPVYTTAGGSSGNLTSTLSAKMV